MQYKIIKCRNKENCKYKKRQQCIYWHTHKDHYCQQEQSTGACKTNDCGYRHISDLIAWQTRSRF